MIYFFNTNGDLLNSVVENVYQGSNKANTIYFVAPFPPDNKVTVNYRLPDGTITGTTLLTQMGTLEQAPLKDGSVLSIWSTQINNVVTAMAGYVTAQFDIVSVTQTVATMNVNFPIIKGVAPVKPLDVSTEVTLQEILAILLEHEGQILYNLADGSGSGSIQQKGFSIPDGTGGTTEYPDEDLSQAYGPNSVALNRARTYQMSSFAVSSGEAGKTEAEFNAWFWDSENNVALHNGQGKDENGNILDNYGRTYDRSFSFAVNLAEGGKAKGRSSVTSGRQSQALGDYSQAHGRGVVAQQDYEIALGQWNEINTDSNVLILLGNGESGNRATVLKVYKNGRIESFNAPIVSEQTSPDDKYFVRVIDVSGSSLCWVDEDNVRRLNIRPAALSTAIARRDSTFALTSNLMNQVVQAALIDPTNGSNVADWSEENQAKARQTLGAASAEDIAINKPTLYKRTLGINLSSGDEICIFAYSSTNEYMNPSASQEYVDYLNKYFSNSLAFNVWGDGRVGYVNEFYLVDTGDPELPAYVDFYYNFAPQEFGLPDYAEHLDEV